MIEESVAFARMLQPSLVVLEDVDLVAEERTRQHMNRNAVLFDLLYQMDGLTEDADKEVSRMDLRELVTRGTILRATVGSTVHGLHHGGQDDRDEMAVFVEPPEYRLGLARPRPGSEAASARALGGAHAAGRCPFWPGGPRSRLLQPA